MKDSRLGTYGALGLMFVILLEIGLVADLLSHSLRPILVAHMLARWTPVALMRRHPLVSPVATASSAFSRPPSLVSLVFATTVAFGGATWLLGDQGAAMALASVVTAYLWGVHCQGQVGGISGDLLGAGFCRRAREWCGRPRDRPEFHPRCSA